MIRHLVIAILASTLLMPCVAWSQQARQASAIADLTKQLASDDAATRAAAARDLWRSGTDAAPALPALVAALSDTDPLVRAYAARAIGATGKADTPAVAALSKALLDPDRRVVVSAADALQDILPDPQLLGESAMRALSANDARLVEPLIETLAAGGERSVPMLIEALNNEENRYWAALILAEIGPAAAPAIPALMETLKDKRPEVQLQALVALGQIGAPAASAVPAIGKFLSDDTPPGVRYSAAFALANIGDEQALPELTKLKDCSDPFLKTVAAWGIARVDDSPAVIGESVTTLVESLQSSDRRVRQLAARALAELQPDRELVRGQLFRAMADADPTVKANVADAIASLGPAAVERLTSALQESESRALALDALERLGPQARGAVPAIVALIKELQQSGDDPLLLANALTTLGAIDEPPAELRESLVAQLDHPEPMVRRASLYLIGKLGPKAQDLAPAVREASESSDSSTQLVAVWALLKLDPGDAENAARAVPLLTGALTSPNELTRIEAATALGLIGKPAQSSLGALQARLNDPSTDVREAAQAAIEAIKGS